MAYPYTNTDIGQAVWNSTPYNMTRSHVTGYMGALDHFVLVWTGPWEGVQRPA